ncbi:hypothetical protein [Salinirubrum litoreum]|uniref:SPW repeat-containing protein n=1 Tax=Salinirubrum litoreum TaxID=1126234 RepID=A0ABD5RF33_9EURY|nr:hypothetical protein [Salinirubrum litoreum]
MSAELYRPLALVGYPTIGFLVLLQIFSPETVAGLPASTAVGTAMTVFLAWGTLVAVVYKSRWTATGFAVMTAGFAVQTLSGQGIQNRVMIYSLVGLAVLLILIGGKRDSPMSPLDAHFD